MQKHKNVPLLLQLTVFLIQLGFFLIIDWLDVLHNHQLFASDALFWSIIILITWSVYTFISYYYSQDRLRSIIQGLLQTIVSYAVVIAIMLFFHQWIGGSF